MRQQKGLFQLGLLLAFPFLAGALCLNSSLAINQSIWNHKTISNYTITVRTIYGAAGILDVQVVVRNNKIIDEKLLECEVGQPEYHAGNCNALTTYYYRRGGQFTHTIDDLFQIANSCLEETKTTLTKYGLNYQLGFTGFTSIDTMGNFINAHWSSLTSSDYFCSVEYDAEYGYPRLIGMTTPTVLDANGAISVKNFHVDD